MGRKRAISTRWRVLAAAALLVLAGAGWLWWRFSHWTPSRTAYPVQGVLVGARDGRPNFASLKAVGADFAYLEASLGGSGRDPDFARNLAAARAAGLKAGALHLYDPCVPADVQAGNFVTVVPRDGMLLPPAVELDKTADQCAQMVSDAEVESELTTFLNQIESHSAKPALLMISGGFEKRYHLAGRIDRDLWLTRDWFEPDYAGRPWTLWTANGQLHTDATERPLRWVVAQP
ncbi:MAG TPA: glycoside hydrolase family 25 protein [Sphingomonadaceae bacterium]